MLRKIKLKRIFIYVSAILWGIFVIFPFYWMLNSSLKTHSEMYQFNQTFYPHNLSFGSYTKLINQMGFLHHYANSLFVTFVTTFLSIIIAFMAAYSLTKLRYPGRKLLGRSVLVSYLVPYSLLVIPLYILLDSFALLDTFFGLILAYMSAAVPFCTWLLMGYFRSIHSELIDAALIDGCTHFGVMWRVILPITFPGLVTTVIYCFVTAWNMLLYPLVLINSQSKYLLPVLMSRFVTGDTTFNWGVMLAGAVLITVPPALFFLFLQRFVRQGLGAGSVKG